MTTIKYSLHLLSDAEIGSGLGGELVNNTVARDHQGIPVIRSTHIKGLMRDRLQAIANTRNWAPALCNLCFGRENCGDEGLPGMLGVQNAKPKGDAKVRTISRTSLTELGVAKATSLRTTEAVSVGSVFHGVLTLPDNAPRLVELASRLALLSICCVGGGRTRGGGACRIEIESETRLPGDLLKTIDREISGGLPEPKIPELPRNVVREPADAPAVVLRLIFRADSPICCPETPVVGSNVIRAGLGVPASAVLGAIISRLASADPSLAQAAFEDTRTRLWPLLPCAPEKSSDPLPVPVRVALSHRMSKLPDEDGYHLFKDAAIEPYDWRTMAKGSPLKGADGVLLRSPGQMDVKLWRSGDMPRLLTSHSVHHGERRNLFTVESLAPMTFSGWISLPPKAAGVLVQSLEKDGSVAFGKARTIRGTGQLSAHPGDMLSAVEGWHKTVFVLQSPAAIPDEWEIEDGRAEKTLARLVAESGWGEVLEKEVLSGKVSVTTQAQCGVRFGWNRHGTGGTQVDQTNRLQARRVFLPGSVFVLKQAPENLQKLLIRGLGVAKDGGVDGRMQGYGSVLPHPGVAGSRIQIDAYCPSLKSEDDAGQLALTWFGKTQEGRGPSPSQIAAVAERIVNADGDGAVKYLKDQKDRSDRVWDRWRQVFNDVSDAVQKNPRQAKKALRTWQDLAIVHREAVEKREGR